LSVAEIKIKILAFYGPQNRGTLDFQPPPPDIIGQVTPMNSVVYELEL